MIQRWLLPLAALVAAAPCQDAPSFQREIRPLLAGHCFACHGPDAGKRKAGLRLDRREDATARLESGRRAIDPDALAASELLARVTHADAEERMPPASTGKPLSPQQIETLRRWVLAGAEYEPHWSFVPPRRPMLPAGSTHPIDAFVQAGLRARGLQAAAPAAPATLLRRITLDLTGLPPTTAELDAFEADPGAAAFARVLDRLFASPRYGEHMARYWLDAARYSDTHGYHLDNLRSIWPYRDWVVQAFQRNQPFDQFTVEQLAGDLLPDASLQQQVATGFHRCLPTTAEGGLIAEEYLAKYAMDRVDTTATVWLGLTLGCAQCHDHKFDPFTQRDYYRLLAFWKNVEGEASDRNIALPAPSVQVPSSAQQVRLAELEQAIAAVEQEMAAPAPEQDAEMQRWAGAVATQLGSLWQPATPRAARSAQGAAVELLPDDSVRFHGPNPDRDVHELESRTPLARITALRIEALPDPVNEGRVGRAHNGNIVLGRVALEVAPLDDPAQRRAVKLVAATADYNQQKYPAAGAIDDNDQTGWAILGGQHEQRTLVVVPDEPFGFAAGTVLHLRLAYETRHPRHVIGRVRVAVSDSDLVLPARISAWRQIGPFRGGDFATVFQTDYGPEQDATATATHGEERWREGPGLEDNEIHTFRADNAAFYFARTITSPNERELTLRLGSDDGLRVWHDGKLVLDRKLLRSVQPDQDELVLSLHAGENRLLVKLVNGPGDCALFCRTHAEQTQAVPAAVLAALAAAPRSEAQATLLRRYWRERFDPRWRAFAERKAALAKQQLDLQAQVPGTLVMQPAKAMQPTHVLRRGRYDQPGAVVAAGVPDALPPLVQEGPATRLDLARWLVRGDHPLTARVYVNRLWQQMFGVGLVKTSEDFGAQGEWPSHPELLDWLAVEFVESGWDVQHVLRLIATSQTYQRSSATTSAAAAADPENRALARGPRHRLDAEVIRDSLLAISGLLVERLGGPGVKPYQPTGLWEAVGYADSNTRFFQQDHGDALWRRSLYTFWKRTAPPPMFFLFDAPMRESCVVRRPRTNTPLQALALLNDVQYVEAARLFATKILRSEATGDEARLALAYRAATSRAAAPAEVAELGSLLQANLAHYREDRDAAAALLRVGEHPPDATLDPSTLAAWTTLTGVLLNLDETITKR